MSYHFTLSSVPLSLQTANIYLVVPGTAVVYRFTLSPPRAANNYVPGRTWCIYYYCILTFFRQCELLGRLDLSVEQLVAFAKEGVNHGDGKVKAKRQELPLKSEEGAKGYTAVQDAY